MFRIPRAAAALAATAAVFTLAGSTVATAAGTSAPARQTASPAVQDIVCTVNDNGVNYRGGPGTNYPVLGQVNKGQKMNAKGREGSWVMGDLWGGRTGVWIHVAYLDC
ncbi:SH3 domain-containing protein [Streptomyces rimosus]|uniref:SH3 domain-containing protein n=1 Tax=Streptomyces rimosus TaxID=1927 RepID=UPI0004C6CBDC|nr:SH3 domain-containing protein [Streptomyces rimosus]